MNHEEVKSFVEKELNAEEVVVYNSTYTENEGCIQGKVFDKYFSFKSKSPIKKDALIFGLNRIKLRLED